MRLVPGNSPPVAESTPPATRKRLPATKNKPARNQNTPPLATRNQPPSIKKVCRSPEIDCRQTFIQIQCIADYWSLSPFMEMRNSWLLIVFSSLFFINSIASTLFISAR